MSLDHAARDGIARRELVALLDEFCTRHARHYPYYPQRRLASPVLRALVGFLRRAGGTKGR